MNNEIKEIINYFIKYANIEDSIKISKLEDYITNLQQEINKLTAESTEWESKYYEMQDNFHNANEEIERLKEWKEDLLQENIELENIRKEAIEYIEKYVSVYDMEGDLRARLLNILKGSENK